jgi:hypothetical protein
MTVYSPSGKNIGVAVIVFPGGGYQDLAIDLEGAGNHRRPPSAAAPCSEADPTANSRST